MDIKQKIETDQKVLNEEGNVVKTRDDRELILVDKDGKVQNSDSCGWMPDDGEVNKVLTLISKKWVHQSFSSSIMQGIYSMNF